jgi:lipoprotein signal peptidase
MSTIWRFLKPTIYKLIFLLGWILYSLSAVLRAGFDVAPIGINLLWMAVFFYIVGCFMVLTSKNLTRSHSMTKLIAVASVLAAADHAGKIASLSLIPVGESIPIFLNRLHLIQVTNVTGPWIFATFGSAPVVLPALILSIFLLLSAPLLFRYYSMTYRQSYWSEVAFICLVASSLSAAVDFGVRGGVVDYLYIPGHFAADLKDIISEVFVSSALIEVLDNPKISIRWTGWKNEFRDIRKVIVGVSRFAIREMRRSRHNQ